MLFDKYFEAKLGLFSSNMNSSMNIFGTVAFSPISDQTIELVFTISPVKLFCVCDMFIPNRSNKQ